MSLFVTDLAFEEGPLVDAAKIGILVASLVSGAVGWTILRGAENPRWSGRHGGSSRTLPPRSVE